MKNKKSNQKMALKIVSVFAALVLWLFVTFTEDALMDINVNSIKVEFLGEQNLLSNNLMIVDKKSVPNASVKIRGRRGDLIAVMDGVSARIDLSEIQAPGTYELTPVFDIPSSAVYVSKRNTLSIDIAVERMVEKTVDVVVVQENTDKNKEYVIESIPKIDKIKIKGEAEDIAKIERAALHIDVSSITEPGNLMINTTYETLEGDKVSIENEVFAEMTSIGVENKLHNKKTVDVVVAIPSHIRDNYSIRLLNQSVDKIDVGVDADIDIENVKAELLNVREIEMGNKKFTLKIDAPNGVYIPQDKLTIEAEFDVLRKVSTQ